MSMIVVQSEESVKSGLFRSVTRKSTSSRKGIFFLSKTRTKTRVGLPWDVTRFDVSGWLPAGSEAAFPGSIFDVDVSHSRPASRTEDTSTPDPRFAIAFPRRARKVQPDAETPNKAGETTTISGERHVAHSAARGVSGRALETNSATRRRVSPLQTTSASPGAFSSSGAAGAHEAARPAPRAVDVDWLIRNTKRALTRRDGRRPRQHRLSEGSARGDHRDAGH